MAGPGKTGRPPITEDTPLTEQEERYVQAVVAGSTKRQAFLAAGYSVPAGTTILALQQRARRLEERLNMKARIDELTAQAPSRSTAMPSTAAPPEFNPQSVDQEWLNSQAYHVHQQAISVEDFSSALRALEFIGRLNGVIKMKNPVGRPPQHVMPMKGETDGNYRQSGDHAPEAGGTEEDDPFSGFLDDGDGDGDQAGIVPEPFFRKQAMDQTHPNQGASYGRRGCSERGPGLARESGEAVPSETSGE